MIDKLLFAIASMLLLIMCSGCVYIPELGPARQSKLDLVGPAGSGKPIQVGVTSRDELVERFGKPPYQTLHRRAMGFVFYRKLGYFAGLTGGPCGLAGPGPDIEIQWLFTEFDDNGILLGYHASPRADKVEWWDFIRGIPDPDGPHGAWPVDPYE